MIKKLRYLFTLMLLLVASVSWAEDVVVTKTMNDIVTANDYTVSSGSNVTCYTSFKLDDIITISTSGEANCGSFWGSSTIDWRLYQNKGGDVTVSASSGYNLKSAVFTYTVSNTGRLFNGNTAINSGDNVDISGSSVTFSVGNSGTATNGQVRITKISVTYESSGDTPVDPVATTTTTIDATGITNTNLANGTAAGQLTATVTANGSTIEGAAVTWNSSNENFATIDANGNVTLVAPGTTTITANYAGIENEYKASSATYTLTVTNSDELTATFNFPEMGYENAAEVTTATKSGITLTFDKGTNNNAPKYYTTGTAVRVYGGNTFTISSGNEIKRITLTFGDGDGTNAITTDIEAYSNGIWTGSANSVTFTIGGTSGNRRIMAIDVVYEESTVSTDPVITGETPFLDKTTVTITAVEGANVYYTLDGTEPTTASAVYSAPFELSATTTVKAIAVESGKTASAVISKTFTKATVMTVADVLDFFDNNNVPETEIYVKGIVSEINSLNTAKYPNARYYISDDGKTTNQFYVYNGKFIDGVNFTADYQLQVGDEVVVYGKLTSYQGTDEFNAGNKIVSFNRPVKISAAKYATYVTPYDVTFESGVTAYSVTKIGAENIELTEIKGGVPAGTAVVVYAADANKDVNTYVATKAESVASVEGNLLKAVTSTEGLDSSAGNYYVLANKTKGVGFYPVTSGTIAKGKGYLEVTETGTETGGAKDFYGFGGDETGINDINVNVNSNDAIYSISGQRLQKLQRGINIVNGKKIVVK